jgi:EAL domain-containing protein (putative c-di-GMP-specific phosphodiesterase class I)
VETIEQWNLLRILGCDEIQGEVFSKPVPWDECMKLCDAPPGNNP